MKAIRLICVFMSASVLMAGMNGCTSKHDSRRHCPDLGFSISFPQEWKVYEHARGTRILAEITEKEGISAIRQNVNVVVEEPRLPVDLNRFINLQIAGLTRLKGVRFFDKGQDTISGTAAQWFTYSNTINDFGYKALVYALRNDKRFYVITGISEYHNFEKYESRFRETALSFTFEQ
jgi:hypothetical protein